MKKETSEAFPAGHYYSTIPNLEEVEADSHRIFDGHINTPSGIDLRTDHQRQLLAELRDDYVPLLPYTAADPDKSLRFQNDNNFFSNRDAAAYASLIMKHAPKRIIEIGSGFSSALSLDINDRFMNHTIKHTFIEPFPDRLYSLLRPEDREMTEILVSRVQDIEPSIVDTLQAGDILFIDSSHVSKVGSDVNFEFFELLPRLKSGVLVHVHDVMFPFEYPKHWVLQGRAWNEAYLLRAFLQFNSTFQIELYIAYLWDTFQEDFGDHPMLSTVTGGRGSFWMSRI